MNLTFSIKSKKKIFNMFGFRSKFCANLAAAAAAAATASYSFVTFCAISCLNGYQGIKTSVILL